MTPFLNFDMGFVHFDMLKSFFFFGSFDLVKTEMGSFMFVCLFFGGEGMSWEGNQQTPNCQATRQ